MATHTHLIPTDDIIWCMFGANLVIPVKIWRVTSIFHPRAIYKSTLKIYWNDMRLMKVWLGTRAKNCSIYLLWQFGWIWQGYSAVYKVCSLHVYPRLYTPYQLLIRLIRISFRSSLAENWIYIMYTLRIIGRNGNCYNSFDQGDIIFIWRHTSCGKSIVCWAFF